MLGIASAFSYTNYESAATKNELTIQSRKNRNNGFGNRQKGEIVLNGWIITKYQLVKIHESLLWTEDPSLWQVCPDDGKICAGVYCPTVA